MLVISLTSVPPRFAGLGPVLESLLAQGADAVCLCLPERYARFPGAYDVPDLPQRVTLLRGVDHGPAAKVIVAQAAFPEATLVYCDDDCLYGPGWLDALCAAPAGTVAAGSVFDVARLRRAGGQVAQGFAGVRLPPGLHLTPPQGAARAADDLWFSAEIAAAGVNVSPCPAARARVTPLARPVGLQEENRPETYRAALEEIEARLGVWPKVR